MEEPNPNYSFLPSPIPRAQGFRNVRAFQQGRSDCPAEETKGFVSSHLPRGHRGPFLSLMSSLPRLPSLNAYMDAWMDGWMDGCLTESLHPSVAFPFVG